MAGPLSPSAQQRIAALNKMADKVQHVYGLVERFASSRDEKQAQQQTQPLKRAFGKLKIELMGAGFDGMSQLAGAMEIAAGRGGALRTKIRILREGIGSLRFQVEQEIRKTVSEDEQSRSKEGSAGEEAARDEGGPTPPAADAAS
jgi:hypothetical protein